MAVQVTVEARDTKRFEEAQQLMSEAQATLAHGPVAKNELRIVLLKDAAELWDHHSKRHGMKLGFQSIDLRTGSGNLSHRQPLARSLGPHCETILDVTGGFGHDAALLACMGWRVTCVERVPAMAAILGLSIRESMRSDAHAEALHNQITVLHNAGQVNELMVDGETNCLNPYGDRCSETPVSYRAVCCGGPTAQLHPSEAQFEAHS